MNYIEFDLGVYLINEVRHLWRYLFNDEKTNLLANIACR